jgi:hypothetical protein
VNIKLLAIDLDGTLYNSQHEIALVDRQALARAHDAGLTLLAATGRGRRGVEKACQSLGFDLACLCSAGALACDEQGRVVSARSFQKIEELLPLIAFARMNHFGLVADTLDGYFWFGDEVFHSLLDPQTLAYAFESRQSLAPEQDFDQALLKVTLAAPPNRLAEAEELLDQCAPSLRHTRAGAQYLDITAHGVDKGSALEMYARYLGIARHKIAAIGDQPIDIPMLRFAGVSAAVSNAPAAVRASATLAAPSNDQGGVAWFVQQILSEKTGRPHAD